LAPAASLGALLSVPEAGGGMSPERRRLRIR
jgi:hypothetical protein